MENRTNMEDDRVGILESQLSQAKLIAEEADKKYEEVLIRVLKIYFVYGGKGIDNLRDLHTRRLCISFSELGTLGIVRMILYYFSHRHYRYQG